MTSTVQTEKETSSRGNAGLSVVVIGRNESEHLEPCLEAIRAMCVSGPIEVIYVDSDSVDSSRDIAARCGAGVIHLTGEPMTAARGRNAGWKAASGSEILFMDGDTEIHPDFVEAARSALLDPSIAAVWGHRRESRPEASVYNRVLDLDWIFPPGWTEFFGGDVLIRREALESVDGYNPELIAGEEPEMCRRLRAKGWRILHIDHPMTRHDLRMSHFSQYWRRATRAGHAYAQVSRIFAQTADPFWSAQAERNRMRGIFWIILLAALPLAALLLRSWWPLLLLVGMVLAASLRSAWKARRRSSSWSTLFLFGLHSHFQEIPILLGQLRYVLAAAFNRKTRLIEYKRVS